jgi:hypothetical protein
MLQLMLYNDCSDFLAVILLLRRQLHAGCRGHRKSKVAPAAVMREAATGVAALAVAVAGWLAAPTSTPHKQLHRSGTLIRQGL